MPVDGEHHSVEERIHAAEEKIHEMVHEYKGSSSSSDSESEGFRCNSIKPRLFGRRQSLHAILGGGKFADIILWRNKQLSGSILAGATGIWLLFECMGYHLVTFLCHSLMLALGASFIWSNAASFVKRSPPKFPKDLLPEDQFLNIARSIQHEINEAFATFRRVACGKDLKAFLMAVSSLWLISKIGNWFSFLTLTYVVFLVLYTAPFFYEKYEDQVDKAAQKAMVELNKKYAVLDAKVLQKIPKGPFSDSKQH